ncbi:hypothetical protein GGX14DRAFT_584103 [Mycena pura]|uniref:Uncharacterized protein n=1 Tax=Mycena pura TaxID=153505 RepID=A0AAD6YVU9_9AGAR|nr:hypothetical protein GGX14DRAFT_584103 [Mycena pura]
MSASPFDLSLTLGPIINGAFFCVFFFGLICMQTISYFKAFPKDVMLIKCTLVYTVCICEGAYTMSVTDFGQIFTVLYTPWGLNAGVVVGSLIDHSVQAFLVARIYRVTKALQLSLFLWAVVAFLQGSSLTLAANAIQSDSIPIMSEKWGWLLEINLFGDAALDIVNACVLCFYLKSRSRSAFSQRNGTHNQYKVAPEDYIWATFYMAMPGSFMSALLANINHRRHISPPSSVVTSSAQSNGLEHAKTTIQFTRCTDWAKASCVYAQLRLDRVQPGLSLLVKGDQGQKHCRQAVSRRDRQLDPGKHISCYQLQGGWNDLAG